MVDWHIGRYQAKREEKNGRVGEKGVEQDEVEWRRRWMRRWRKMKRSRGGGGVLEKRKEALIQLQGSSDTVGWGQ